MTTSFPTKTRCRAKQPELCRIHHPELKTITVEQLEDKYGKTTIRRSIALTNDIEDATANDLVNDSDIKVLENLAQNPTTPQNVLNILSEYNDIDINLALARNEQLPAFIIIGLYDRTLENPDIQFYIAKHPNTPQVILNALAETKDTDLMVGVASNFNSSPQLLDKLLTYTNDSNVWGLVASNPNCSHKTLENILKTTHRDNLGWISTSIARNPNAPTSVLKRLVSHNQSIIYLVLASNPNADENILNTILDKDPSDYMLAIKVASHSSITPQLVDKLLKNYKRYPDVAEKLASNPNIDDTHLFDLFIHSDKDVRTAAYYNPKSDEELRIAAGLAGGINHNEDKEKLYWEKKGKTKPEDYIY